jgi:hypothetical protein
VTMTTGRRLEWRLSAVEFDVLWQEFGRGIPPYPLELPSPGRTYGERAEIVAQVWAELARRGIVEAGRDRRLPPDIDDTFTVLDAGEIVIDGLVSIGEQIGLLAARDGGRGALVVQHGDDLLLIGRMDGALLSGALVELLPDVPAADGQPVSLPYQVLAGVLRMLADGGGNGGELEQTLRDAGVSARDVRWIAGLAQGEQSHAVQFGVNINGNRIGVLSWYATKQGGVLVTRQKEPAGDWVTITPSDPTRLVGRLDELVGGLPR